MKSGGGVWRNLGFRFALNPRILKKVTGFSYYHWTRENGLQDKDMGVGVASDTEPQQRCGKCGEALVLRPVPGAKTFPRRLECPAHGWEKETVRAIRMRFHKDRPNW